jgi:hypothetical protein
VKAHISLELASSERWWRRATIVMGILALLAAIVGALGDVPKFTHG